MSEGAAGVPMMDSTADQKPRRYLICPHCDWGFQVRAPTSDAPRCPHCYQAKLALVEAKPGPDLEDHPIELVLPFALSGPQLEAGLQAFAGGIRFAPADLTPQRLASRVTQVYLPVWLVDVSVEAVWQAEAGFNYQVVSHESHFNDQRGWQTRQVEETQIRWEPRAGRLARQYPNLAAPALEEAQALQQAVGPFDAGQAGPASAQDVPFQAAWLRLPNRIPADAWPAVVPALHAQAARECRQAVGADHIRRFQWAPEIKAQTWTLLAAPLYTTYYQDDEGHPQPVLIHGRTGRVHGRRRASPARARRASLTILAIGVVVFLLSLLAGAGGVLLPVLLPLAGVGVLLSLIIGALAAVPPLMVWQFNRSATNKYEIRDESIG